MIGESQMLLVFAIFLFIFMICLLIYFRQITSTENKTSVVGDNMFILNKTCLTLINIFLYMFVGIFGIIAICSGTNNPHIALSYLKGEDSVVVKIFFFFFLVLFFGSVCLIPFTHTIVDKKTGKLDTSKTNIFVVFYDFFYSYPFLFFLLVLFGLSNYIGFRMANEEYRDNFVMLSRTYFKL